MRKSGSGGRTGREKKGGKEGTGGREAGVGVGEDEDGWGGGGRVRSTERRGRTFKMSGAERWFCCVLYARCADKTQTIHTHQQ